MFGRDSMKCRDDPLWAQRPGQKLYVFKPCCLREVNRKPGRTACKRKDRSKVLASAQKPSRRTDYVIGEIKTPEGVGASHYQTIYPQNVILLEPRQDEIPEAETVR